MLEALVDAMFTRDDEYGTTYAVVIVHRDEVVVERYGGVLPHFDRAASPVDATTPLLSWSMAKSVLHAAVGVLVGEQRLALDAPAPVPEWSAPGDPRGAITLEHLLTMRDGLAFVEDYVDGATSDVIEMLFGGAQHDVAAFAADRALAHPPGTHFNYSSGTSNIIARIVGDAVGGGADGMAAFLREAIFDPIGMSSALPRFDDAGTWIGSTFLHATARDFARFGLLYLHDGICDGVRVVPEGWVEHGRMQRSIDPENGYGYGAHWWMPAGDSSTFWASGYAGQTVLCVPDLDLVVVRMGNSEEVHAPALHAWRLAVREAFRNAADART